MGGKSEKKQNWGIKEVDLVLEELQNKGVIKPLGKLLYDEYSLPCLGLKNNQLFDSDRAVKVIGKEDAIFSIFIEVDKAGSADHNVIKYLPYILGNIEKINYQHIFLLHILGDVFLNNNLVSSRRLAKYYGQYAIPQLFPKFHYEQSEPMHKEQISGWLREKFSKIL